MHGHVFLPEREVARVGAGGHDLLALLPLGARATKHGRQFEKKKNEKRKKKIKKCCLTAFCVQFIVDFKFLSPMVAI
jgi:hypothetical protein